MQRKKMRKLEKYGRGAGMGKPENRPMLEEVLVGCANGTARAQLRARVMRGVRQ